MFQVYCWFCGYIIGLFICLYLILTLLRQRDLLCSHFANCVFLFCRCSGRIYYHSSRRGKDQDHARKGIHTETHTHTQSAAPLLRGACKHCLKVMACRQRELSGPASCANFTTSQTQGTEQAEVAPGQHWNTHRHLSSDRDCEQCWEDMFVHMVSVRMRLV